MSEGIEPISQVQNRSHYEAGCMAIFSILDCIDPLGTCNYFGIGNGVFTPIFGGCLDGSLL